MFVVVMSFTKKFDADDDRVQGHRRLIRELVASGQVVLAGPRKPQAGGVMVFNVPSEDELLAILQRDPMRVGGLIEDQIFEFKTTAAIDEKLLDPSVRTS